MISLIVTVEVDPARVDQFVLTEAYDDEAALEAHRNTPHFILFKERASDGLILNKSSILSEVIDG